MISVEPLDFVYFECDLFTSREKIIRSQTVLGTPRLRANAGRFNISLGELGHPDRGWNGLAPGSWRGRPAELVVARASQRTRDAVLRAKCLPVVFLGKCSLARRQLPGHGVTGLKHTGGRPGPSGRDGDTHVSKRAVEREIDVRDRLVHVEAQGLAVSLVALHGEECQKEPKRRVQPEIRTLPKTYRTH